MDFDSLFEKLVRFLAARDEINRDLYKGAGAMEHFRAGYDFAHKQHRAQARTALISVALTVAILGAAALIYGVGTGHMPQIVGSLIGYPPICGSRRANRPSVWRMSGQGSLDTRPVALADVRRDLILGGKSLCRRGRG